MMKFITTILLMSISIVSFSQVPPSWTVNPSSYSNSATVSCKINEQCLDLNSSSNAVAAFVNGQCRGVAYTNILVPSTGDRIATLTIYSNISSGELVSFQAYNNATNSTFIGIDTVVFKADSVYKSIVNPFEVTENHTPTDIQLSNTNISENAVINDLVGNLSATDDDNPNIFTFSLLAGVLDNDDYLISGTDLLLNKPIDYALDNKDSVQIAVTDAGGCTYLETFILNIVDVTYPPVANVDVLTSDEDLIVTIPVLTNDTDLDNDIDTNSMTIAVFPSFGTVLIDALGQLVYTPNTNYFGNDTIVYSVCDLSTPSPLCDTAIVLITIMDVEDAPVANPDFFSIVEDISSDFYILNNDSDADDNIDTTSLNILTNPTNGVVTINADWSINYTPNIFFNGNDTIVYQLCDLTSPTPLCDTAIVVITVVPVPNAPIAANDTVVIDEDVQITIAILANDFDADNDMDTSSITFIQSPTIGSVVIDTIGQLVYDPNANQNGNDTIVYIVCDMTSPTPLCDTAVVYITVNPIDDAPEVIADSYAIVEDTPTDFYVINNDFDVDDNLDTLSLSVLTNPTNGTATVNTDGSINYSPNVFFNGNDTIVYQLCDLTSPTPFCDTAIVLITVVPVPNAPIAANDTVVVDEDFQITIAILANDFDADNDIDTSSITFIQSPTIGSVVIDSIGQLVYNPSANQNGNDTIIYIVCDMTSPTPLCDTAVVYITVNPIDDAPEVIADSYAIVEDTPTDFYVINNDFDVDNNLDTLSLSVLTNPTNGTATVNTDGSINYSPNVFFNGNDTIVYQFCDLTSPTPLCDTAIVVITVIAIPNPPVAQNDTVSVNEDVTLDIFVLANDSDPDNDIDSSSVTIYLGPFHGVATVDSIGKVSFVPTANFNGVDSIYYSVCDLTATTPICDTAVVYITIDPIDDTPEVNANIYSINEDTPTDFYVINNDFDVDNNLDTTSLNIITNPSNGTVLVNSDGSINYSPNAYFNGNDTIVYEVCDLTSPTPLCDTAIVIITVIALPNAPEAYNDTLTVDEEVLGAIQVLSNDFDADNDIDSSSVTIYLGPQNGTASVDTLGNISYVSNLNYNGLDSLYYVVCDMTLTGALCDTAMFYINVLPIADAPQASNDAVNTPEDTSVDIDVVLNDTDPENDIDLTSLTIITNPVNGVATVVGGQITYLPNSFYYGLDSLVYQICDLTSPIPLCDTAVLYITVDLVPNAPIDIIIDTLFVKEDNDFYQRISYMHTVDNDIPDSYTYELVSGTGDEDNDQMYIEDSTLFIQTKTNFDIKQQYNFRVMVTDSYGLTYEEAFILEVVDIEGNNITLPSANFISPNGDGRNDFWTVENVEIYKDFKLMIVDQFGFILHEVENGYDNTWDGTYNGAPLKSGNYYYIFQSETKTYKGNITIVNNK